MGFFSNLLKGAIGFVTGGPVGAVAGFAGGVLGDKAASAGAKANAAMARATAAPVVNYAEEETSGLSPEGTAFLRAYLAASEQRPLGTPVTYDAQQALQRRANAIQPLQRTDNQRGGMSWPPRDLAFGLGAGTSKTTLPPAEKTEDTIWRDAVLNVMNRYGNQYTAGSLPAYQQYMGQALSGQSALPQEAYARALRQGMSAVNAQAQRSRELLQASLGARGLAQSGLMSRGLVDIERERLGGLSSLAAGLAEQDLAARRQAQQAAAAIYPQLIGVQSNAMSDWVRNLLATREMELRYGQLGVAKRAQSAAEEAAKWGLLGNLASGFAQWYYGPQNQPAVVFPAPPPTPNNNKYQDYIPPLPIG